MATLVADIETDGLDTATTNPWILSVYNMDTQELRSFSDYDSDLEPFATGVAWLNAAETVIGHNFIRFDHPVLRRFACTFPVERVIDTLVLSRLGNPNRPGGHALGAWGEALGFPKQEHEEWDRYSQAMRSRCETDVMLNVRLYEKLAPMLEIMPKAVALEHEVAQQCWLMYNNGFRLDVPYAQKLEGMLQTRVEEIERELRAVFPPIQVAKGKPKVLKVINRKHPMYGILEPGDAYQPMVTQEFNPGSRQHIAKRLVQKYGWKPTKFTPGGEPEISETVLGDLSYPEARPLMAYLKATKALGFVAGEFKRDGSGGGWLKRVTPEGRVHAHVNPCGTLTGRPSCSRPNLQQVFTDAKLAPYDIPSLREAWVPEPGWKLVGCDAEGIELRGLAHFLYPYDDGAYAHAVCEGNKDDGTDVHTRAMVDIGFYSRDQVKRVEYGYLYGAGDAKLGLIQQQDAQLAGRPVQFNVLGLSPGRSHSVKAIGKAARKRLEEGLNAGDLIEGLRARARSQGFVRGLDKRKLRIRSMHSVLNTILQSAGGVIMKKAMALTPGLAAEAGLEYGRDWRWVMWIHDEFQVEANPECAEIIGAAMAEAIRQAGPTLGFRCPLTGKHAIGNNWSETH